MQPIPTVEAVAFLRDVEFGSSEPAILRCRDQSGKQKEYVTKFRSKLFREEAGCAYECFVSRLASHFLIDTPEPAVVVLTEGFANAFSYDPERSDKFKKNVGPNFGSKVLEGSFNIWPAGAEVPDRLVNVAAEIVAFDALIDNENRESENPNLLASGSRLVILDHEVAFKFLPGRGDRTLADAINDRRSHPLRYGLRRKIISLDRFTTRLKALSDERLEELVESMPDAFPFDSSPILEWIKSVREEADLFSRRVLEVLQ